MFVGVAARTGNFWDPIKFMVTEAFKGVTRGSTILIHPGGGDCVNLFEPGQKYLIFASQIKPGDLPDASKPTGSLPVSEAGAILRWLRGRTRAGWNVNLLGTVWDVDSASYLRRLKPLAGAQLQVTKDGVTATAISDANGVYQFAALPQGEYELRASFTGHRTYERKVRVDGCCTFEEVGLWVDGHVSGMVRDESGTPADGVRVELIPVEPNGVKVPFRQVETKDGGQFLFQGIPPGRYLVGVNALVSPAPDQPYAPVSSTIALGRNEQLTGVQVRLPPPLPSKQVRVGVLMPNGRPAGGAILLVNAVPAHLKQVQVHADAQGRASYSWVQGSASSLYVYTKDGSHYASATVKPAETSVELKLTSRVR